MIQNNFELDIWESVNTQLQNFLVDADLADKLHLAFGASIDVQRAIDLIQDGEGLEAGPKVEFIPTAAINGANGAFAGSNKTIYLAQELVATQDVAAIAPVLLEEFGHYLDWQLNTQDALGDEGAIFAHLVQGYTLNAATLQALKAENDHATVVLNGEVFEIEQAVANPTVGELSASSLYFNNRDLLNKYYYENVQKITPGTFRARFKNITPDPDILPNDYAPVPGTPGGLVSPVTTITPLPSTVNGLLIHTATDAFSNPAPWPAATTMVNLTAANSFLAPLPSTLTSRYLFAEDTYTGTNKNLGILRYSNSSTQPVIVTLDWQGPASNDLDLWLKEGNNTILLPWTGTVGADKIEQFFFYPNSLIPNTDYYVHVGDLGNQVFTQDFSIFLTAPTALVGSGHGWGDVHLQTFDGKPYEFQAFGEFTLVKSLIDDFEVQTRQEQWVPGAIVSVNTAFATVMEGYQVVYDMELPNGQELSIDGQTYTLQNGESVFLGSSKIERHGNKYTLVYAGPDGTLDTDDDDRVTAVDQWHENGNYINIYVDPADYRSGLLEGLLGNGDGNPLNDFALRNGKDLGFYPQSSVIDKTNPIHTTFADSWRITQEESLFNTPGPIPFDPDPILYPIDPDPILDPNPFPFPNPNPFPFPMETIQTEFADSWRITQMAKDESLYEAPIQDPVDGIIPIEDPGNEIPISTEYISLATLTEENPAAVAEAFELAEAAGIPQGQFLSGAVLDFLLTGEEGFIEGAAEFSDFVLIEEGGDDPVLGEIKGYKWNDFNRNGIWEKTEQALAGWTIYLDSNDNGQLEEWEVSVVTDATGAYSFTDLGSGSYQVREVMQDGWEQIYPSTGNQTVELEVGEIAENINFGNRIKDQLISGTPGKDNLSGGGGDDTLLGFGDNDTLKGNEGNDILIGGSGNDQLTGDAGNDTMSGGTGNDTYTLTETGDVVIEVVGEGLDVVKSSVSETLDANVENLVQTGTAHINGTGNALNNSLTGNNGNNILNGGAGNDILIGGNGNDQLIGGAGNDKVTGGAGADKFIFNSTADKLDTITDFNATQKDQIRIKASGFKGGLSGGKFLPSNQFVLGTAALDADDRFIYNKANGALFYDLDGLGGTAQVQIATLTGAPTLAAGNIYLF